MLERGLLVELVGKDFFVVWRASTFVVLRKSLETWSWILDSLRSITSSFPGPVSAIGKNAF